MKNVLQGVQPAPAGAPATPAPGYSPSASDEVQGHNPAPTRAPLASRSATPGGYNTSGMEKAMGTHADKVHPIGKRR